jgi:hypothetical protein
MKFFIISGQRCPFEVMCATVVQSCIVPTELNAVFVLCMAKKLITCKAEALN